MSRSLIIFIFSGVACTLIACNVDLANKSTCVSCHRGLAPASASHPVCIDCHGGNSKSEDKNVSHQTMLGPINPSDPKFWAQTCGRCHPYQLNRIRTNIMFTNTGMIKNIQETWEGQDGKI